MALKKYLQNLYIPCEKKLGIENSIYNELREKLKKLRISNYHSRKSIYISNIHDELIMLWINRFILAKGISERLEQDIIFVTNQKCKKTEDLYKQLGTKNKCIQKQIISHPFMYVKTILQALKCIKEEMTGEKLLKFSYHDCHIGEFIYDKIIAEGQRFTIDKVTSAFGFKELQWGMFIVNVLEKWYKKNPPSYVLVWDRGYDDGICAALGAKYGARVVEAVIIRPAFEVMKGESYEAYPHNSFKYVIEKYLSEYEKSHNRENEEEKQMLLQKFILGIGNKDQEGAYDQQKWSGNRQEVVQRLKMDSQKKNVVIMFHCFVDWVHCSQKALFQDYFRWAKETIEIISNISNVNWLLKPHPSRHYYKYEYNAIYDLWRKYNRGNLYYVPDDMSTSAIINAVDVAVTVQGTAGIEFATKGIPVILAGDAWYRGASFTLEPQSIEEYTKILQNAERIPRLKKEQIEKAENYYWAYNKVLRPYNDHFTCMLLECYQKYYKEKQDYTMCNNDVAKEIIKYLMMNDVEKSQLYMVGKSLFMNEN